MLCLSLHQSSGYSLKGEYSSAILQPDMTCKSGGRTMSQIISFSNRLKIHHFVTMYHHTEFKFCLAIQVASDKAGQESHLKSSLFKFEITTVT